MCVDFDTSPRWYGSRSVPSNASVLWSAALSSVQGMRGVYDAPLQGDVLRDALGKDVVAALFTSKYNVRLKKYAGALHLPLFPNPAVVSVPSCCC